VISFLLLDIVNVFIQNACMIHLSVHGIVRVHTPRSASRRFSNHRVSGGVFDAASAARWLGGEAIWIIGCASLGTVLPLDWTAASQTINSDLRQRLVPLDLSSPGIRSPNPKRTGST